MFISAQKYAPFYVMKLTNNFFLCFFLNIYLQLSILVPCAQHHLCGEGQVAKDPVAGQLCACVEAK